jgi:hypothetical protein
MRARAASSRESIINSWQKCSGCGSCWPRSPGAGSESARRGADMVPPADGAAAFHAVESEYAARAAQGEVLREHCVCCPPGSLGAVWRT